MDSPRKTKHLHLLNFERFCSGALQSSTWAPRGRCTVAPKSEPKGRDIMMDHRIPQPVSTETLLASLRGTVQVWNTPRTLRTLY